MCMSFQDAAQVQSNLSIATTSNNGSLKPHDFLILMIFSTGSTVKSNLCQRLAVSRNHESLEITYCSTKGGRYGEVSCGHYGGVNAWYNQLSPDVGSTSSIS